MERVRKGSVGFLFERVVVFWIGRKYLGSWVMRYIPRCGIDDEWC